MADIAKLVESVASLLWPLIVIAVVVVFRPAVREIMASARSRKFTLKIGGQELTMEEANEQQQKLIADLQSQVVDLRRHFEQPNVNVSGAIPVPIASAANGAKAVLWVDDNPKNNSYFVQQLSDAHIKVDLALSTNEAVSRFSSNRYAYVISDMGRQEDCEYNPDAGIDLLRFVRERDKDIPFVIFCSTRAAREYGSAARELGATAVTSSPTELFGILGIAPTGTRR